MAPLQHPKYKLKKGHRIEVTHFRKYRLPSGVTLNQDVPYKGDELLPRGGATLAEIYDKKGNLVAFDVAVCSERDNYNKRLGKAIAVGRALKAASQL